MRKILIVSIMFGLIFFPMSGYCLDYYVNGTTGTDSDTCGQTSSIPCKTIRKALDNIPDGEVTIKIARGTYVESELLIPVTAPGSVKNDITFEGGWNGSFDHAACNPENTVVIPGNRTAPPYMYLFDLYVAGDERQAALTLRCMKIQKTHTGDITRTIHTGADHQGKAEISLLKTRLTGFTEQEAIFLLSIKNGILNASINESVIDTNTGYTVISGDAHNDGILHLTMNKSSLHDNGSQSKSTAVIYLNSSDGGNIDVSVGNSIISGNASSGDPPGCRFLTRDSNSKLSLSMVNTTLSGNTNVAPGGNPGAMGIHAFDNAQCNIILTNTIIRKNSSLHGPDDFFLDQANNATMNLTADYCILGEYETNGLVTYTSNHEIDADPGLNSSYHLISGSPAKDAGICGYLTGSGPYQYHRIAPYDDIDSDKRPGWGKLMGCDIGADEYRFPWILFNPATRGTVHP